MRVINTLIDDITTKFPDIKAIYVFGSWGTQESTPRSDIDLALLLPRPLPIADCWELAQELAILAKRDVEVIDLLTTTTVMRAQIIAKGRRVFCAKKSECEEFEDLAFSTYARLNEERREILRDIQERGHIYAR